MYQEAVKRAFPSYLLGRFGNTIFVFDLLTDEERLEITKLYIRLECQKFASQYQNDFSVQATDEFLNRFIARIPPEQGARPIERQITKVIGEVYDLIDQNKMPIVLDWKGENPEAGGKTVPV
jgi:ATP-dependent Clp protease ATP-binding subunit ClpA